MTFEKKAGLSQVKKIVAVSSCKGGVGKSTMAINLAFALKKVLFLIQEGKKVGIFDADIFGPSLPTLISREDAHLYAPEDNPKSILPIEYEGVKTMSYGFTRRGKAVMRGPMISSVVVQLLF